MKFTVCFCFLLIAVSSKAQEFFQFKQVPCDIPEITECCKDKFLGEMLSIKIAQFNRVYTKEVSLGPPSYIESLEIKKPDLYYSVQKLTNHYRKCIKKEIRAQEEIENEMVEIINKSIMIFTQKTDSVEDELRQANNSEEIKGVFDRIIIE